MKRILPFVVAGLLSVTFANAEELAPPPAPKREKPAMSDEQKAQLEERLNKTWSSMPLENKMRLMRLHRALHQMPPEERKFVHDRVERFLNMSPEERHKLRENAERWKNMTPEERERARERFRQRRREFEEKWRREHPGEEPPPFPFRNQPTPPAEE